MTYSKAHVMGDATLFAFVGAFASFAEFTS
jgi:hypothetical protein